MENRTLQRWPSIHDILRTRLLQRAGLWFDRMAKILTADELEKEVDKVWHKPFFELMRNRLRMGHLRYGSPKGKYNFIKSIETKLKIYKETGNDEMMVDISNLSMLQFSKGTHPTKHFSAMDDVGHATLKK